MILVDDKGQILGQLLELIKDVPFFKPFNMTERYYLASTDCEVLRYHANEDIIKEGDSESALYILLRGEVGVTKCAPSADSAKRQNRTLLAKLSVGAVFGEITLISKRPRTSGVYAIGEAIILKMDGNMMQKLEPLFRNKIQAQLIDLLVKRLDDMNNQMCDLVRWQKS